MWITTVWSLSALPRTTTSPSCCGISPLKMREITSVSPRTRRRRTATTVRSSRFTWWTKVCDTLRYFHTPGTKNSLDNLYCHVMKSFFSGVSLCVVVSSTPLSLFSVTEVDNTLTVIIVSVLGGVIGLVIIVMVIKALVVHFLLNDDEKK